MNSECCICVCIEGKVGFVHTFGTLWIEIGRGFHLQGRK
jgi:hypothetical protein